MVAHLSRGSVTIGTGGATPTPPTTGGAASSNGPGKGFGRTWVGQFRAKECPICGSPDNGKWTCALCTPMVNVHRELIRNLQSWHSMFEAHEVDDTLVAADGQSYCLWDIDIFYGHRTGLPAQMQRAIELCLYENIYERQAAVLMGVRPTNPVSIYATIGLTQLIALSVQGEMAGYILEVPEGVAA